MHLDQLFWSKAKVDILKYLLFKRQWVSMRALETELTRTFPAIKKQIDSLKKANIVEIWNDTSKRSITIRDICKKPIRSIFVFGIESGLQDLFNSNSEIIERYYLWKFFGSNLDMDLIIIHNSPSSPQLESIKKEIEEIFKSYFLETISVVFMSSQERDKRYRLADKFVLNIMKHNISPIISIWTQK